MTRKEAEDYVYRSYLKAGKYQDYHAKDSKKRDPALTREILREKAGTPCVVVTGSKGKGSVSSMISKILESVYRTGLMTSPHLIDFCERFRINGQCISDSDFVTYMTLIRPELEEIERRISQDTYISPMGIQADLALAYFNASGTEFNVMECGKGARYDDVNNVKHDYAVINSIFCEHTRELGETLEAIAEDKSYVIDGEQKCVYSAWQQAGVMKIIEERAAKYHIPLKVYGRDFRAEHIRYSDRGMVFDVMAGGRIYPDIFLPLLGEHQARNCALAVAFCLDVSTDIDAEKIKRQLAALEWPGRMEVLSSDPFIMLDACINPASCAPVKSVMEHLGISRDARQTVVIIGIPDDKDYAGVVREMAPAAGKIILTRSQNPHYTFTAQQCRKMKEENIDAVWTDSVQEALALAKKTGKYIIILGTTSLVSEVKILQSDKSHLHKKLT